MAVFQNAGDNNPLSPEKLTQLSFEGSLDGTNYQILFHFRDANGQTNPVMEIKVGTNGSYQPLTIKNEDGTQAPARFLLAHIGEVVSDFGNTSGVLYCPGVGEALTASTYRIPVPFVTLKNLYAQARRLAEPLFLAEEERTGLPRDISHRHLMARKMLTAAEDAGTETWTDGSDPMTRVFKHLRWNRTVGGQCVVVDLDPGKVFLNADGTPDRNACEKLASLVVSSRQRHLVAANTLCDDNIIAVLNAFRSYAEALVTATKAQEANGTHKPESLPAGNNPAINAFLAVKAYLAQRMEEEKPAQGIVDAHRLCQELEGAYRGVLPPKKNPAATPGNPPSGPGN